MSITRRAFSAVALAGVIGAAPRDDGDLKIATLDSCRKVRADFAFIDQPRPSVRLHAPRNSRETFQIVMQCGDPGPRYARLFAEFDSGASSRWFPTGSIELFHVHRFEISERSNAQGATGSWPDPLAPISAPVRVFSDAPVCVWVRIRIGSTTPVGTYAGAVSIDFGASNRRRVNFEIEVHSPTLPSDPTLPFLVGLDWDSLRRVEAPGDGGQAHLDQILPGYLETLSIAGATPFNPFDRLPDLPANAGDLVAFDDIDRRIEAFRIGPGTPVAVPFSLAAPVDAQAQPLFSEAWRTKATQYLRAVADHYEKRGLLSRAFVYVAEADEPIRRGQIEQIVRFRDFLSQADPRLRFAQTIHARCVDCEADALRLLDAPSVLWTPNIAFYDGKALAKIDGGIGVAPSGWPGAFDAAVRSSGREIWWYFNPATDILPPRDQPAYPNLYIDHDAMAHRVIGWMAWDQRISGYGHWMATLWRAPADPWSGPPRGFSGHGPNGDGVLLYPASGAQEATGQPLSQRPATSIRLEMLRETGQDHKLLVLAEQRLGREAVQPFVRKLFRSLEQFSLDPGPMREARLAILKGLS